MYRVFLLQGWSRCVCVSHTHVHEDGKLSQGRLNRRKLNERAFVFDSSVWVLY